MLILFDPLRHAITGHLVVTTAEQGWDRLANGWLLAAAEEAGFDILVTADKGFLYQQDLTGRRIGIVVLSRGNWPDVRASLDQIRDALTAVMPGVCLLVRCAPESR